MAKGTERQAKFIQILTYSHRILALDEDGHVWQLNWAAIPPEWTKMPSKRKAHGPK